MQRKASAEINGKLPCNHPLILVGRPENEVPDIHSEGIALQVQFLDCAV